MKLFPRVIFGGPLPPPTTGLANVNLYLTKRLIKYGFILDIFNFSTTKFFPYGPFKFYHICKKLLICFRLILKLFDFRSKKCILYLSASGDFGQIFELVCILVACFLSIPVFYHHHSYKYINTKTFFMTLIACVSGDRCTHVFLGETMKQRFLLKYRISSSLILCNAFITLEGLPSIPKLEYRSNKEITISHFSNLSEEKGLDIFINTAQKALESKLPWKFILGGPFDSLETKSKYLEQITSLPNLNYIGFMDRESISNILSISDFFLFPSRYVHEASPLVLYEAMKFGCIPIASSVGMIAEIVSPISPILVLNKPSPIIIVNLIKNLVDSEIIQDLRQKTIDQYHNYINLSQNHLSILRTALLSTNA